MNLRLCSVLAFLLITSLSFGQQKLSNTLLWRISGKGLKKPSYLYGTMHLTDKRIFNFGDSVYRAIESCEGLAIELNPDEMGAYLINQALDAVETNKLSEILDKREYNKYSASLSKKFNKPAEELTTADIIKEKNKWISEYLSKGEMPTFVDAWLYNAARRQGKWVGGIEDMGDQNGLMNNLFDKTDIEYLLASDTVLHRNSNDGLNKMIDLYINQDLAGIDAMSNTTFAGEKDWLLIKRNVKMARRIDSLMAFRTMFCAVGAAHLPGDSGVIDLLRKRGFTVEPIFSSKKINASDYKIKDIAIPWQPVEDAQKLYQVAMPGNPATVKLFDMIEMKFLLDLSNLSNYCTMAIVNPDNKSNKDSLLTIMASRMLKKSAVKAAKKVFNHGIEGKEFIQEQNGENIRMQAFLHGKIVYVALMYAIKKEVIASADADKFFASFTINQTPVATASSHLFTDSIMGISFRSPAKLEYNSKLSSNQNGWKVTCFNGADHVHGIYTMLFSKEIGPGNQLPADSMVQNELVTNLSAQSINMRREEKIIGGYKAMHLFAQNADRPGLYLRAVSIIRDNRNLLFLTMSDSANLFSPEVEGIYSSLQFLSPVVEFKAYVTPDQSCRTWAPGPFRPHEESDVPTFISYDTTTATTYMIMLDTVSRYAWYANDSSFWKSTVPSGFGTDSVISEKDVQSGSLKGKEFLFQPRWNNTLHQRIRMYLNGTVLYKAMMGGKKEQLYNAASEQFFSNFTVLRPAEASTITQSKAALIFADLLAEDSIIRVNAFQGLNSAPFEKKDIPLLQQALFKQYKKPNTYATATMINNRIAVILAGLNDSTATGFVLSQYPLLTGDKEALKNPALLLLGQLKTKESYAALGQLILQQPPVSAFNYQLLQALEDSLQLTATLYPALQTLFKDSACAQNLAGITLQLWDSGFITKEQVLQSEKNFLNAAMKSLPAAKKDEDLNYELSDIVQLIGHFKTAAANKVLSSLLTVKTSYLKEEVVKQLVSNKQPVPATVLNQLAADDRFRTILYDDLKELKRTDLFPKKYLTQAYFAAAAVHAEAEFDDLVADKVTFLFTKTATYKGKIYTFYLFKVDLVEDVSHLGIAGGYLPGSMALYPKEELSGLCWDDEYDTARVNEMFKEYLKKR